MKNGHNTESKAKNKWFIKEITLFLTSSSSFKIICFKRYFPWCR